MGKDSSQNLKRISVAGYLAITLILGSVASATVVKYPFQAYTRADEFVCQESQKFDVSVNNADLFVEDLWFDDRQHWTAFASDGPVEITVTVTENVSRVNIWPSAYGIAAQVSGKTITFTAKPLQKLRVSVNDIGVLFIFVDPLEENPPQPGQPGVHSVIDAGVDSTGVRDDLDKINGLIESVSQSGGGTVYIPAGKYYNESCLNLQSNVSVYLAPGAYFRGSLHSPPGTKNTKIFGRGMMRDAKGSGCWGLAGEKGGGSARLIGTDSIDVEGITFMKTTKWSIVPVNCRNINIYNVKLINPASDQVNNKDGLNLVSCRNAVVDQCFIRTTDDAIAVKVLDSSTARIAPFDTSDNLLIQNCVVEATGCPVKLGTETFAKVIRNVTYRNIYATAVNRGLLFIVKGIGTRIEDFAFENIYIDSLMVAESGTLFNIDDGGSDHDPQGVWNVTLKNWFYYGDKEIECQMDGSNMREGLNNLTVQNVFVKDRWLTQLPCTPKNATNFSYSLDITPISEVTAKSPRGEGRLVVSRIGQRYVLNSNVISGGKTSIYITNSAGRKIAEVPLKQGIGFWDYTGTPGIFFARLNAGGHRLESVVLISH